MQLQVEGLGRDLQPETLIMALPWCSNSEVQLSLDCDQLELQVDDLNLSLVSQDVIVHWHVDIFACECKGPQGLMCSCTSKVCQWALTQPEDLVQAVTVNTVRNPVFPPVPLEPCSLEVHQPLLEFLASLPG